MAMHTPSPHQATAPPSRQAHHRHHHGRYLNSGFVKGFTRLLLLWFIPLLSFFTPARCAFIDGMEAWDSGHLTFVCYVMTRVSTESGAERRV